MRYRMDYDIEKYLSILLVAMAFLMLLVVSDYYNEKAKLEDAVKPPMETQSSIAPHGEPSMEKRASIAGPGQPTYHG